ncbi:hypothetical protein G9A89_020163 [Geosiphon pyriformis]|nr:hypothetical protein G9A89_020163 [Geosiphon pyriformis]
MAYASITKIEKFTGKENDAQIWLNDIEKAITANGYNDNRALQTIPYFLQNTANLWYQTNLSTASISNSNLSTDNAHNLSAANTIYLLTAVLSTISATTNSNTATKLTSKQNPKTKNDTTKLEIRSCQQSSGIEYTQNLSSQNYLSLLITPEDATSNNLEIKQTQLLTSNILLATIINDKLLTAIFPFELKKLASTLLFNGVMLEEKPITTMYIDVKMDGHFIKLILDSGLTGSIITRQFMDQLMTKTSIGKIDNFLFKVNSIITPIKVLVIEAMQYQALVDNDWLVKTNAVLD